MTANVRIFGEFLSKLFLKVEVRRALEHLIDFKYKPNGGKSP